MPCAKSQHRLVVHVGFALCFFSVYGQLHVWMLALKHPVVDEVMLWKCSTDFVAALGVRGVLGS